LLKEKLEAKLENYQSETHYMPFLTLLVQDPRLVVSMSFMISLATTLGASVYEEMSAIAASESSDVVETKVDVGGTLNGAQIRKIADIVNQLRNGQRTASRKREIEEVLSVPANGGTFQKKNNVADFYMKRGSSEFFVEIKTVKPNIDVFTATKEKLLEWVARKQKPIRAIAALPYNPYEPKPYERYTVQGVLEKGEELIVGKAYWDLLGGTRTYEDILSVFDEVGKQYQSEIQRAIDRAASSGQGALA